FAFGAIALIAFAMYAFVFEPYNFEVRYERITSDKISKPIKIALMADLQTDHVGDYEKMVLTRLMSERPDLILIAGDLVQEFPEHFKEKARQMNTLLKNVHLSAPLGVYFTRGDADHDKNWRMSFDGLPVEIIDSKSKDFETGELAISALCLADSCAMGATGYKPRKSEKYHIIVGHRPDYFLDTTDGDLLVGGHTHGGQVKIPGFGPPITISRLPRDQAGGGLFTTAPDRHLLVTRGPGMERKYAPRLRVLCRPEIVILTLAPTKKQ
ncbi:MAG: metallophosphoesterase, partial [Cyanobacteria bacterium]|nr:metallophosphoesterase [Cyanobacteriota bacterium]